MAKDVQRASQPSVAQEIYLKAEDNGFQSFMVKTILIMQQANAVDLISYGPCIILQYICNPTRYVVGSKSFRPDQLFKVTEIKQLCYFST